MHCFVFSNVQLEINSTTNAPRTLFINRIQVNWIISVNHVSVFIFERCWIERSILTPSLLLFERVLRQITIRRNLYLQIRVKRFALLQFMFLLFSGANRRDDDLDLYLAADQRGLVQGQGRSEGHRVGRSNPAVKDWTHPRQPVRYALTGNNNYLLLEWIAWFCWKYNIIYYFLRPGPI